MYAEFVCFNNIGVHILFSKFSVLSYFARIVDSLRQNLEAKKYKNIQSELIMSSHS